MAGLTVESMRKKVAGQYDSWRWRDRVSKMATNQVIAIYRSMDSKRQFEKKQKTRLPGEPTYRQLTLFDFGLDVGNIGRVL